MSGRGAKVAQVRQLLTTEGWTVEKIPYADAYQRLTVKHLGYKRGNSNQLTAVAQHCAYIELWTANPANEPSYQRGQHVLLAFDADGRVLKTSTWADGTGVWHGPSLTVITEHATRYGPTGQAIRDAQSARTAADSAARQDQRARAQRLVDDANIMLADLGHMSQHIHTSHDGSMIYLTDHYGSTTEIPADMERPVRCTCGQVYDLNTVHPTGRHADCTVWRAPCCGREADDRIWNGGHNGFTELIPRNRT